MDQPNISPTESVNDLPEQSNSINEPESNTQIDETQIHLVEDASGHISDIVYSNPGDQFHVASTSAQPAPQDKWSRHQHIELVNIIDVADPGPGMLTRSKAAKLTAALANVCLFSKFLSPIEPKSSTEALKHAPWIDAMQEEL